MKSDLDSELVTNKMTEEECLLILWAFITDMPEKEWQDFSQKLIYKNRFIISHKVVDTIKKFSDNQTSTINKGKILYRARIYSKEPFQILLSEIYKNVNVNNGYTVSKDIKEIGENYNLQLASVFMALENKTPNREAIIESFNKWKRKRFKGFNAKDSGIPPADKTISGRINPERISYLYLAEEPATAVYEVRPIIGQKVSIATFEVISDLKIYDMTVEYQDCDVFNSDIALFNVIRHHFSEPNTGDAFNYLPTQYLSEIIKQMGFDGIRFKSSLKVSGNNVVLFDAKKCKAICSDITQISDIELKLVNPEIYGLEKYIHSDRNDVCDENKG